VSVGPATVEVAKQILEDSERSLRRAGRDGCELFVLWSGRRRGESFEVLAGHVPRQTSLRTKKGLLVRIEGDALHKLNTWLYEHGHTLVAQLHAHPEDAYHSETDDTYPIVTQLGGLSLVAADFCRDGLVSDSTAAYRLSEEGWVAVRSPINELVRVV
jgi:hypothetical protein